ncbi:MAG: tRNA (guanine-N2)-dimethyltransferase, partial [Armatimonadia bacterium]|nr:tRNA (guanine-N2)-dimethyltransferase [Armatimonadia bacterium]
VVRSAEAVGVAKVHIIKSDGLGQSFSPKVTRGAERWLEVEIHSEPGTCLARLAEAGMAVYCSALAEGAVNFRAADYTRPCAIAVGSEGEGASASLAALSDRVVMIPMMGLTESLSMGAAAAVLLYEAQRQRQLAGMYATPGLDADAPAYLEGV